MNIKDSITRRARVETSCATSQNKIPKLSSRFGHIKENACASTLEQLHEYQSNPRVSKEWALIAGIVKNIKENPKVNPQRTSEEQKGSFIIGIYG